MEVRGACSLRRQARGRAGFPRSVGWTLDGFLILGLLLILLQPVMLPVGQCGGRRRVRRCVFLNCGLISQECSPMTMRIIWGRREIVSRIHVIESLRSKTNPNPLASLRCHRASPPAPSVTPALEDGSSCRFKGQEPHVWHTILVARIIPFNICFYIACSITMTLISGF